MSRFALAAELGRVPMYEGFQAETLRKARDLLTRIPAVSLHDHPVRLPEPISAATWTSWRSAGREQLGHAGLSQSGWAAVVASALSTNDLDALLRWAAVLRSEIRGGSGDTVLATSVTEVPSGGSAGPIAIFLGLEDLGAIGEDLTALELLYSAGVRSAGLAYNGGSALGGGLASSPDEGLTAVGRRAVKLMNDMGMVVDLAHVGDTTALDACRCSRRPVVVSHAGARSVWPTPRMKPDAVLDAVADTGGVVAVEAAPYSTLSLAHPRHNLSSVMDHVCYLVDRIGIDHVALGPDTFFGDHVGLYNAVSRQTPWEAPAHEEVEYVDGVENPGEAPRNIAAWLIDHGWSGEDTARVMGGNALRVLAATLDTPTGSSGEADGCTRERN